MSDVYVECLVKAKQSLGAKFLKTFLIVLTALLGLLMMLSMNVLFMLLALITGVAAYFVNLYSDIEYEYLYLDKELVVDKVLAKSKRKRVATYAVEKIEILAPFRSYHLDNYKHRDVKEKDYSIGEECQPDLRYVMYYEGAERVILSPSSELIKAVKNVAPRKVFTD